MSTLNSFRQILLDEITQEDLDNLADVATLDANVDPQFVYKKLARGEMLPWRVETSKGNGFLVLEIQQKPTERTLYVWYVSGKGMLGHIKYITETLVEVAKMYNCDSIEALTTESFAKYLGRVDFRLKHCFIRKELN